MAFYDLLSSEGKDEFRHSDKRTIQLPSLTFLICMVFKQYILLYEAWINALSKKRHLGCIHNMKLIYEKN